MSTLLSTQSKSNLLDNLLQDTSYAVSDGSFYHTTRMGSCTWIISTPDSTEWVQGEELIPGCKEDQGPYCSELGSN